MALSLRPPSALPSLCQPSGPARAQQLPLLDIESFFLLCTGVTLSLDRLHRHIFTPWPTIVAAWTWHRITTQDYHSYIRALFLFLLAQHTTVLSLVTRPVTQSGIFHVIVSLYFITIGSIVNKSCMYYHIK
jgi:hypothetical protein